MVAPLQELDHLKQFGLRWDLLNKHMFYTEVYRDSNIHSSIPTLITQLRYARLCAIMNNKSIENCFMFASIQILWIYFTVLLNFCV